MEEQLSRRGMIRLREELTISTTKQGTIALAPGETRHEVVLKIKNPISNQITQVILSREDLRELEQMIQISLFEA